MPAMRSRIQAVAFPSEIGDFSDEVRRVFLELGRAFGGESLAGECSPAIDVFETDDALTILIGRTSGFAKPKVIAMTSPPDHVMAADLNGDSKIDLVTTSYEAKKVTVLHEGSVLAEGSLADVQNDSRVIEVYLGR